MSMGKQVLLLTALGLMFVNVKNAEANCTSVPDCGSLGYKKSENDCNGASVVRCPFDVSKVFCKTSSVKTGNILYGDGTVSSVKIEGKTPIGVVFDPDRRLAFALTYAKKDGASTTSYSGAYVYWVEKDCEIPNLTSCDKSEFENATKIDNRPTTYSVKTSSEITCATDGEANTQAILATNGGCSGVTYAANSANAFEPSGCSANFCKKGKWFLPSVKDLVMIRENNAAIDVAMTEIGGVATGASIWSSNVGVYYGENIAYNVHLGDMGGLPGRTAKTGLYNSVRPIVKY